MPVALAKKALFQRRTCLAGTGSSLEVKLKGRHRNLPCPTAFMVK